MACGYFDEYRSDHGTTAQVYENRDPHDHHGKIFQRSESECNARSRLEEAFRQSLVLSKGDFSVFISRPLSLAFLITATLLVIIPIVTQRKMLATLEI